MAQIASLRRYPLKGFDANSVDAVEVTAAGTLAGDREYALCDPTDREPLNGKRLPVHEVETALDPETGRLSAVGPQGASAEFALPDECEAASEWFSEHLDRTVRLDRADPPGFVDRPDAGPSVVSTATLEAIASWFDELTVEGVRRRLRANVEVEGVPAFWEDRFVGEGAPAFGAGGIRFEGVEPCVRCVVPARDPDTGEPIERFRERFVQHREATFPEWADPGAFDSTYSVMLIARVPESDRGQTLAVGDAVEVVQ